MAASSDVCVNCGKLFLYNKKRRTYDRQGLLTNLPSSKTSIAQLLSEEWPKKTVCKSTANNKFVCKVCVKDLKAIYNAREKSAVFKAAFETRGVTGKLWKSATVAVPQPPQPKRAKRANISSEQSNRKRKKQKTTCKTLASYIRRGQYAMATSCIAKKSPVALTRMHKITARKIKSDVKQYINTPKTVLRQVSMFDDDTILSRFNLAAVVNEVHQMCPTLTASLRGALCVPQNRSHLIIPIMGSILCMIAFAHKPKAMGALQHINAIQMWLSGSKRQLFNHFNALGWCVNISPARKQIDKLTKNHDREVQGWKHDVAVKTEEAKRMLVRRRLHFPASEGFPRHEDNVPETSVAVLEEEELPSHEDTDTSLDVLDLSGVCNDIDIQGDADDSLQLDDTQDEISADVTLPVITSTPANETARMRKRPRDQLQEDEAEVSSQPQPAHSTPDALTMPMPKPEAPKKAMPKKQQGTPYGYTLTFDNVNMKTIANEQFKGHLNKQYNMVQSFASRDRIAIPPEYQSAKYPDFEEVENIPLGKLLPSEEDEENLKEEMTIMVERMLVDEINSFKEHYKDVNWHIRHEYSEESRKKSETIPLGVIDHDETKPKECINIMTKYTPYLPDKGDGPVETILWGDGLSCKRIMDAQKVRKNGANRWRKQCGFIPGVADWHKRCILLQDTYDELYAKTKAQGTLYNLRNSYDYRAVTGAVKTDVNAHVNFLNWATKTHVLAACYFICNMSSAEDTPEGYMEGNKEERRRYMKEVARKIVDMVFRRSEGQKVLEEEVVLGEYTESEFCVCKQNLVDMVTLKCDYDGCKNGHWFHASCLGIDEEEAEEQEEWYCSQTCKDSRIAAQRGDVKGELIDENDATDHVREYAKCVIWNGLNEMIRHDAVKENDGHRIIRHWRFDLLLFLSKNHPIYSLLGTELLMAINGAVSPRVQFQLKWSRTVSTTGGKGNNHSQDIECEFYNKQFKESIKSAGGNMTEDTIQRHSKMLGFQRLLWSIYTKETSEKEKMKAREKRKKKEEKKRSQTREAAEMLHKKEVFHYKCGRKYAAFPDLFNEHVWNRTKVKRYLEAYKRDIVKRVRKNAQCNDEDD